MLSAMEYPHWIMVAGAVLVVLGFIGFIFHKNKNPEPAEDTNLRQTAPEPIQAALALQLPFLKASESMGNHDSAIVDAGSVD
jgi:hypothetical protein